MELRAADREDAAIILEWRNDDTVRANSFSKDIISWDEHIKWFERKMADENCLMFILEDEGERVGSLRLDITESVAEISYMVAPGKRGKGYGKQILSFSDSVAPEAVKTLVGLVEKQNEASIRCFESDGYVKLIANDIYCFIKSL